MSTVAPPPNDSPPTATPPKSGLMKSASIVSVLTLLSRVLGLARDVTFANLFGAGSGADAFFVAFKIPNFFRRLFAEGAFAQAFVPVLSEYRTQKAHAEVKLLIAETAGSLAVLLLFLTVVVVLAAPYVVMVFAPGFMQYPDKMALAADLLRYTFPYLLLISLTAFAGSILNSYSRFAAPAFTPVLLNVVLISSAVFVAPYMDPPILALGVGVLAAGFIQLSFQLPFLGKLDLLPKPKWGWRSEGVVRIRRLMIPALFGVSVGQINLLLDTVLASFLVSGSVSWLYYSDRLMELPLGVFGIAIATVILPSLSRKYASDSPASFSRTLDWAVRMVLLIGAPAALALAVLAEPLLITLFQYGQFSGDDVMMASLSLRAYALGLLAFMLIKVLAPGYFARQDTKTPVKVGIAAMVANMVFNLMLIFPLAHAGLALATSLSAFLNAGLLLHGLVKAGVFVFHKGWGLLLLRLVIANAVMVLVIWQVSPAADIWLQWGWVERSGWLMMLVSAGVASYFGCLLVSGMRLRHLRVQS